MQLIKGASECWFLLVLLLHISCCVHVDGELVKAEEISSGLTRQCVFVSLQRGVLRCQLEEEEEWRHKDHLPVRDERFLCHGLHHRPRQLPDRTVVPWSVCSDTRQVLCHVTLDFKQIYIRVLLISFCILFGYVR